MFATIPSCLLLRFERKWKQRRLLNPAVRQNSSTLVVEKFRFFSKQSVNILPDQNTKLIMKEPHQNQCVRLSDQIFRT